MAHNLGLKVIEEGGYFFCVPVSEETIENEFYNYKINLKINIKYYKINAFNFSATDIN